MSREYNTGSAVMKTWVFKEPRKLNTWNQMYHEHCEIMKPRGKKNPELVFTDRKYYLIYCFFENVVNIWVLLLLIFNCGGLLTPIVIMYFMP